VGGEKAMAMMVAWQWIHYEAEITVADIELICFSHRSALRRTKGIHMRTQNILILLTKKGKQLKLKPIRSQVLFPYR
jgi:hypothetical protein